jgi:hypothetical protein
MLASTFPLLMSCSSLSVSSSSGSSISSISIVAAA